MLLCLFGDFGYAQSADTLGTMTSIGCISLNDVTGDEIDIDNEIHIDNASITIYITDEPNKAQERISQGLIQSGLLSPEQVAQWKQQEAKLISQSGDPDVNAIIGYYESQFSLFNSLIAPLEFTDPTLYKTLKDKLTDGQLAIGKAQCLDSKYPALRKFNRNGDLLPAFEVSTELNDWRYSSRGDFSEGLAWVKRSNRYGYINESGAEVIPMQFDSCSDFQDGMAVVRLGKYFYVIDRAGEIISERWLFADYFGENWFRVKSLKGYWKFENVDWNLRKVFYPRRGYSYISARNDKKQYLLILSEKLLAGRAMSNPDRLLHPLDVSRIDAFLHGGELIKIKTYPQTACFSLQVRFEDDNALHECLVSLDDDGNLKRVWCWENEPHNISDLKTLPLQDSKIDKRETFSIPQTNLIGCVYVEKTEDSLNKKLRYTMVTPELEKTEIHFQGEPQTFGSDYLFLRSPEHGQYGIFTKEGKQVEDFLYQKVYPLNEGRHAVKRNGVWGFLDVNAREVIPPQYDQCEKSFSNGFCQVAKSVTIPTYSVKKAQRVVGISGSIYKRSPWSGLMLVAQKVSERVGIDCSTTYATGLINRNGLEIFPPIFLTSINRLDGNRFQGITWYGEKWDYTFDYDGTCIGENCAEYYDRINHWQETQNFLNPCK